MADIIVAITLIGNGIIVWLCLWRGWAGRLQWFTVLSALSILLECIFYFIYGALHHLYSPLRVFIVYWLVPILEVICAYEAYRVKVNWLERLMLIQVAMAILALYAHRRGDIWTVYYLEMFVCYFNAAGILFSIWKLKGECTYEPREKAFT